MLLHVPSSGQWEYLALQLDVLYDHVLIVVDSLVELIVLTLALDLVEVQYVQAWLVGLLLFLVLALEEVMLDEAWMLGAKVEAQQVLTVFDQFLSIVLVEVFDHAQILVAWVEEQHVLELYD